MFYEAIVMGVSAGGLATLTAILKGLPDDFPLPVIITQHRSREERTLLEEVLQARCTIRVRQAEEKERIAGGSVYFAPPDYHLLIGEDKSFVLNSDELVNFSRPSIDLLFESAAEAYEDRLVGIILTGASKDGAEGIRAIDRAGGYTIAQDPSEAAYPLMPRAAIATGSVRSILTSDEIGRLLLHIGQKPVPNA